MSHGGGMGGPCSKCYGNDDYGCVDGDLYKPCVSVQCDGLCEYAGECGCECHRRVSGPIQIEG
jgi:hypothetical protein